MKELVCDMCGSNNIIKQNGLFVCQACNTKYSIEEARKMMFGDVVEVEGTVKIDNSSELANLYELARRAKETNDTEYALKYYEQILIKDPNSWEAQYHKSLYRLYAHKITGQSLEKFNASLKSTVTLINDQLTDDIEKTQALVEITNELLNLSSKLFENNYEFIKKIKSSNKRIVGEPHNILIETSNILFEFGDQIIGINDKSRNFALSCWEQAIDWGTTFNYIFDRSTKNEHKNLIESYIQKIQQYNPQYEPPKYKKSITKILW